MQVLPINKNTVLSIVRKSGVWEGFIAPNKVNNFHIVGGWHLGHRIKIQLGHMYMSPDKYIVTTDGQRVALEKYLLDFEYYNCKHELGNRPKFWACSQNGSPINFIPNE